MNKIPDQFIEKTVNDLLPGESAWIDQQDLIIRADNTAAIHKNTGIALRRTTDSLVEICRTCFGGMEIDVSLLFQAESDYTFSRGFCESEPLIAITYIAGLPREEDD